MIFAPGVPDLLRDTESVVSGYFSMASSAPHLFGDRAEDFANEVRELLRSQAADRISGTGPATPKSSLPGDPAETYQLSRGRVPARQR